MLKPSIESSRIRAQVQRAAEGGIAVQVDLSRMGSWGQCRNYIDRLWIMNIMVIVC